jgi:lysylphosphatidylglycerol synthetase-like protein (DUF2156 family)
MKSADPLQQYAEDWVLPALARYADNPSAFLALNGGNEYFRVAGLDGFICFRRHGRRWLQFGGPFTREADRKELETRFLDEAHANGRRVLGVQLQRSDAELFAALGHTVNQIGASYVVDLTSFSLRGKRCMRLRNKISRALREGLEVTEADAGEMADAIGSIDSRWLRHKGRHIKELRFLVGEIGGPWQQQRKLFVGSIDGTPIGYVSYVPVYGSRPGWLHDLSRRLPDCPPGVMEAINARAIERFSAAEVPWLHFGFTPFTSLDAEQQVPTASRAAARIVRLLADHGDLVYPAKSQLEYKMKWQPSVILPEYFSFDGGISIRSLMSLLAATNAL